MMTYEELMQWLQGAQTMPIGRDDYNAMAYNPNDVNPTFKGPGDPIWSGLQGSEAFYQAPLGYDAAPNMNRDAMWDYLNQNGQQWMSAGKGNETVNYIQGPNGPIADTANFTRAEDDNFKLAALAAMGITGANVLGAMGGAPAASSGGGAEGLYAAGGDMGVGGYTAGGGIGTLPGASSLPAITSGGVPALESIGGGGLFSGLLSGGAGDLLKLGTIAAGAIGGSKPSDGKTTTEQSKLDPQMQEAVYGGYLPALKDWYQANKAPNDNMRAGWDRQLGLLNDPRIAQQMQQMQQGAYQQSQAPIAGNPFASGAASLMPSQWQPLPRRGLLGG